MKRGASLFQGATPLCSAYCLESEKLLTEVQLTDEKSLTMYIGRLHCWIQSVYITIAARRNIPKSVKEEDKKPERPAEQAPKCLQGKDEDTHLLPIEDPA